MCARACERARVCSIVCVCVCVHVRVCVRAWGVISYSCANACTDHLYVSASAAASECCCLHRLKVSSASFTLPSACVARLRVFDRSCWHFVNSDLSLSNSSRALALAARASSPRRCSASISSICSSKCARSPSGETEVTTGEASVKPKTLQRLCSP